MLNIQFCILMKTNRLSSARVHEVKLYLDYFILCSVYITFFPSLLKMLKMQVYSSANLYFAV